MDILTAGAKPRTSKTESDVWGRMIEAYPVCRQHTLNKRTRISRITRIAAACHSCYSGYSCSEIMRTYFLECAVCTQSSCCDCSPTHQVDVRGLSTDSVGGDVPLGHVIRAIRVIRVRKQRRAIACRSEESPVDFR